MKILEIQHISKKFRIGAHRERYLSLRDQMAAAIRRPFQRTSKSATQDFWALRDVSFDVEAGESVGIVGKNGAGKSTLLKILSKITPPTSGKIICRGRVASLLEVGTGFHPELTGRENIYMNGSILGLRRTDIERQFDAIVDFSGVEHFLDTPLKHFSSGMQLRLAFAVAAHLEPEILIIDEVLAVGDAEFQKKCIGKMGEVSRSGRTILFVSHNLTAVTELCQRAVLLDGGRITATGSTKEVANQYLLMSQKIDKIKLFDRKDRQGNQAIFFLDFFMTDELGNKLVAAQSGKDTYFCFEYEKRNLDQPTHNNATLLCAIDITTVESERVCMLNSEVTEQNMSYQALPNRGFLRCKIPKTPFQPGQYGLVLFCSVDNQIADWIENNLFFEVIGNNFFDTGKLPLRHYGASLVAYQWTSFTQ